MEVEHEFSISAKKLFDIIFDEKSTIWPRLHKKKGNTLLHSGPWVIDNSVDGERRREFKFIMPVNNPMMREYFKGKFFSFKCSDLITI